MAYATTADVKAYLNIGTTTDDALLAALIARAQALVDGFCERTFEASADTTRSFDAVADVDGRRLYLDADLCSIHSVTNGDGTTVASTHYVTEPRNATPYYAITLKGSSGVAWTYDDDPENAIAVSGKWAYSSTPPADISQATVRLTAWLYRQRDNSADIDRALIAGDVTILPLRLPQDVQAMLARYKRLV